MSASSHLTQLKRKHQELEQQIEEEERSPGTNSLEISQLKRAKLRLKEEIVRFSAVPT